MGVPNAVTAVTFVALGTSLPDTFASKTAAVDDPYADASVGNVTGSNSVNVFLGLGLPWTIGALYWEMGVFGGGPNDEWRRKYPSVHDRYPDGRFAVIAGSLSYSVTVFTVCAVSCLVVLLFRRKLYGGELGGPVVPKYVSAAFLVFLWISYIAVASTKFLAERKGWNIDFTLVLMALVVVALMIPVLFMVAILICGAKSKDTELVESEAAIPHSSCGDGETPVLENSTQDGTVKAEAISGLEEDPERAPANLPEELQSREEPEAEPDTQEGCTKQTPPWSRTFFPGGAKQMALAEGKFQHIAARHCCSMTGCNVLCVNGSFK